ncbi:MAG: OmpA family protein [Paracoccaceae bacterium]
MSLKIILAYLTAAVLCVVGAFVSVEWIEDRSAEAVQSTLIDEGAEWTEVTTDGLLVSLSGQAPDEASRFRVVSIVGQAIDPDRIVDEMAVRPTKEFEAPEFSVEMLRNGDGISLIGLIPEETGRSKITNRVAGLSDVKAVTDLLETANYEKPNGWDAAIAFATEVIRELPRSKVSAEPGLVQVTAISDSPEDKRRIEQLLTSQTPSGITLEMNISAPRPVIAPFTLRYTLDAEGGKFDACSADEEETARQILNAAAGIGYRGPQDCAIGLGMPSPNWGKAVEIALKGLKEIGGGSLTFSNADITLIALDETPQAVFDRVVGDLDATLPDVFSLHAVLPEKIVIDGTGEDETVVEFVATRSPEGLVQLRGRIPDEEIKEIVLSYAHAQFGTRNVYMATREDADLPGDWAIRVLTALEALSQVKSGSTIVQADYLELRGVSGSRDTSGEISRLLADKLGAAENFEIAIRYDELLDPLLNIPTPQECVESINTILAENKIVFEPSSAELTEDANATVDRIAEILRECSRTQIEIGGHTDSQGREIMNLNLSQQRADAVLAGLMERRILTRNITAKGYGETVPIADNGTEEGRETNRRIEFRLITDVQVAESPDTAAPLPTPTEETEAQSEQN